jgi:hypothetical protein
MNACVFLAVPHYNGLEAEALPSLIQASQAARVKIRADGCSLLAHNFNRLWCQALNERRANGFTHFAMHHADQGADAGWLDALLGELERTGADIISVVVPLKDGRGLTSTALYNPQTAAVQRLTMREVMNLPETFEADDISYALGRQLLVNTGLWVCRLDATWVDEFPGFEVRDAVVKCQDGQFRASVFSEDWNASAWWAKKGVKVVATRKVGVRHIGRAAFGNADAWGDWETDNGE